MVAKKKTEDFFSNIVKELDDENTVLMSENDTASEYGDYIDTGSYTLNALISGSLYGGIPDNKVVVFCGTEATGKTFFVLSIVKNFFDKMKNAGAFYFDTEQAVTKKMMTDRGLDIARIVNSQPITVEDFRYRGIQITDNYAKISEDMRPPAIFVLDSLGNLSTNKEVTDTASTSEKKRNTKDMTKAGVIKGSFRILRSRLARLKIPMLVTNHVYAKIGSLFPEFEQGGGSGPKYAGDIIVFLGKAQYKESEQVAGSVITMKTYKSRITREKQKAKTLLRHDGGLDRYYGLVEIGLKHNVFGKSGNYITIGKKKAYESVMYKTPEKYFTEDIMQKLEVAVGKEFKYTNTMEDHIPND